MRIISLFLLSVLVLSTSAIFTGHTVDSSAAPPIQVDDNPPTSICQEAEDNIYAHRDFRQRIQTLLRLKLTDRDIIKRVRKAFEESGTGPDPVLIAEAPHIVIAD